MVLGRGTHSTPEPLYPRSELTFGLSLGVRCSLDGPAHRGNEQDPLEIVQRRRLHVEDQRAPHVAYYIRNVPLYYRIGV